MKIILIENYRMSAIINLAENSYKELIKNGTVIKKQLKKNQSLKENFSRYFVLEVFRSHPSINYIQRKCNKNFILSTDWEQFKFHQNDIIHIPVKQNLNLENYFPQSELFNPFRFKDENQLQIIENFINLINCPGIQYSLKFTENFVYKFLNS